MTKAQRVRFAIASCEVCFEAMGKDMWTLNEFVEELWFRVEQHVEEIERAEAERDELKVKRHLNTILSLLTRIEDEMATTV